MFGRAGYRKKGEKRGSKKGSKKGVKKWSEPVRTGKYGIGALNFI